MERNTIRIQSPTPAPAPVPDRPTGEMTGRGILVFQITTAGGAIPLEGAEITLRQSRGPTEAGEDVLAVLYSGWDGKTAPGPYALYNADVKLEGFYKQSYIRIPVFDGITSIQRASLIPLPENGYEGGSRPDGETFVEGENPDL